jgi:hypothetical protein
VRHDCPAFQSNISRRFAPLAPPEPAAPGATPGQIALAIITGISIAALTGIAIWTAAMCIGFVVALIF